MDAKGTQPVGQFAQLLEIESILWSSGSQNRRKSSQRVAQLDRALPFDCFSVGSYHNEVRGVSRHSFPVVEFMSR